MDKQLTGPISILVVDDDAFNRKLLGEQLAAEGYAIRDVASGEAALEEVAEQLPDLILLDIMMPGLDGFEVTRRIKADPRSRSIPIILVTGLEDGESRLKGLDAGAEEFLTKPVDRAELLVRSRNLLKLREYQNYLASYNCILEEQVTARTTALQESEAKFRKITESAQDAIVMADADQRICFWNAAAERMFGMSEADAKGYKLSELIASAPDLAGLTFAQALMQFALDGQGPLAGRLCEFNAQRRGGEEFPIELSVSWLLLGERKFVISIVRDITERKRNETKLSEQYRHLEEIYAKLLAMNQSMELAQNQLLQSEKMASIGLLAAGVAHEINNPIGYVNSNLGTLEKYLADIFALMDKCAAMEAMLDTPADVNVARLEELRRLKQEVDFAFVREDIKALLAESHQGLERVKKIVLDLKKFVRSDTEEQWMKADIHRGIDATLNIVWNELKYKCEVVKEYGDIPNIYCLPSQLDQMFMNLLVNASQAIEVRGKITIRTGQEGDRVWIEVEDTGKGIPAEDIPRLFDPFFTTKPVGKGTGLGLSVSYNIVEKHHGSIEVRSEVGKGSTFRVWLPVQQSGAQEME